MSKYKVNNHSVLNVSNEEAKQSASWHDIARRRAHSQHGGGEELDPNDIHAVRKHEEPDLRRSDPQEIENELHSLEDQIKQLQETENQKAQARQLAQQQQQQQKQHHETHEEDPYEDWFKE